MASDTPLAAPAAATARGDAAPAGTDARDERGFPTDGSFMDLTDKGPADPFAIKVWRAKRFTAGLKRMMHDFVGADARLKVAQLYDGGMNVAYAREDGTIGENMYIDQDRVRGINPDRTVDAGPLLHLIEEQEDGTALVYAEGDKTKLPRGYPDVFKALERTLVQQEGQPLAELTESLTANIADMQFHRAIPGKAYGTEVPMDGDPTPTWMRRPMM
ncbi:MAG: hypothetical protein KI792_13595 [Alphaproteobacteria bacterium]|nr:hypothetical protein [Alphaproteobacteria bacterium SS10]